tara:strand:- start:90 stop:458 length:369 start_codon:yes stop_codon:yes gene_type:complete
MTKILIVDDANTIRMQLRDILESEGYDVVEGVHGADGLAKAQENTDIDLIITDYNMPEMDGVAMCRKIKEIDAHSKVPMFMLTTESTSDLKELGKQVGVMAWIVKPFNEDKLKLVIKKVLKL